MATYGCGMRILIMGLPGSGKTTMAKMIVKILTDVEWLNADNIREQNNDWDFSTEGRIRQARRLRKLADNSTNNTVVCDFVAGLEEQRKIFDADFIIWMDTISKGRFDDTNAAFEPPNKYDIRILKWQILTSCA